MIKFCQTCKEQPAIPRGKYCQEHRYKKKKICNFDINPKCEKKARGQGEKPGYCVEHGGGKKCFELDCKNIAQGGGKPGCCVKHGGGKKCIEPDCENFAQGGGKPGCCVKHGGGKKCIEPDCKNVAVNGGKSGFCIKHGGGKKCIEPDCENLPQGGGKSGCCKAHGGGKRCPNCINWIDSRVGTPIYDGYCATCFKVVFPTDERSKVIYQHTKEIMVRNIINANFDGFIHDTPLYTGDCDCTHRRRIDHRKLIGNTILAIETDEFAHRYYDKEDEEIRYNDVYMIHSGKWIFIRFNPDDTKTIKVDIEDKLICLIETIQKHIDRIENEENIEPLEIYPLYY